MTSAPSSILIYGCGKMGEAILSGWLASDEGPAASLGPGSFTLVERTAERRDSLAQDYGVQVVGELDPTTTADVVVLAVKPQSFPEVLPIIRDAILANGTTPPLIVSIAAGIPTATIEQELGSDVHVVRVMPNLPLQVGAGATVVSAGAQATDADVALVRDLFAALGEAHVVDEDQIDAVCAISGGGPAYFASMIEMMRDAGVKAGLDANLAESLAQMTLYGTGLVLQETDQDAATLRQAVCSPGGTTLAALSAMEAHGIRDAVEAGIDGAIARAEELSTC